MTAVLLGLGAAVAYGVADFCGGLTNRRATLASVVIWSQTVGLVTLLPIALIMGSGALTPGVVQWGLLAGLAGSAGVSLLYHGLSIGTMSTVAPLAGVLAAAVPFTWGIARGERPSAVALGGVVLALTAIVLVSRGTGGGQGSGHRGVIAGLAAGAAFGGMYVFLAAAGDAGLWPIVVARTVAVISVGLVAAMTRQPLVPPPSAFPGVAATGVLDMTANSLYVLAAGFGLVSLVAVLASLYPAATIVLARLVLHERLGGAQKLGLVAAATGVALIAA